MQACHVTKQGVRDNFRRNKDPVHKYAFLTPMHPKCFVIGPNLSYRVWHFLRFLGFLCALELRNGWLLAASHRIGDCTSQFTSQNAVMLLPCSQSCDLCVVSGARAYLVRGEGQEVEEDVWFGLWAIVAAMNVFWTIVMTLVLAVYISMTFLLPIVTRKSRSSTRHEQRIR